MQEIKCPKCGEVFAVDESDYAQIVQQVRDNEFDKDLKDVYKRQVCETDRLYCYRRGYAGRDQWSFY